MLQYKTLKRIKHEKIINTTCSGMPNSCTIQRRHNLWTKQQVKQLKKNTQVKMKEILSSGKRKKRNRGGRNVNIRFNHTTDYSSY